MSSVSYDLLPDHMQAGARLYVERGVEPGSFMFAVLCNNLTEAFARADSINADCVGDWARWLLSDCPRPAWGNREIVEKWIAHGGLERTP